MIKHVQDVVPLADARLNVCLIVIATVWDKVVDQYVELNLREHVNPIVV